MNWALTLLIMSYVVTVLHELGPDSVLVSLVLSTEVTLVSVCSVDAPRSSLFGPNYP